MSRVVLMVAEKPSVAELIAQKLNTRGLRSRKGWKYKLSFFYKLQIMIKLINIYCFF